MSCKSVLVNYLERNKVFIIPASTDMPDISFLEREFKKEFKFQGNVNIGITFQRFDKAWEEYVDIDEACQLDNKEKLKAVVLPLLSDRSATPSEVPSDKQSRGIYKNKRPADTGLEDSNPREDMETDDSLTDTGFGMYSACSSASTTTTAGVKREGTSPSVEEDCKPPTKKRKKVIKTADDHIPLPNPFPLPKHYRADVEVALDKKEMTAETTSAFLSSIASAMLVYKRYPTREDYITVGRSVIQQYDFMAQPTGTPYGGIVQSLMNRFKEFRRSPIIRGSSSSPLASIKKSPKRKSPGITQTPRPPLFSPGEDAVSLERHENLLKSEFKKKKRNDIVVSDLMKRTFPLRRQTILEKPMTLDVIFERFPFLQDIDQVMADLEQIHNQENLRKYFQSSWAEISVNIIAQAQLEKKNRAVRTALEKCEPIKDIKGLVSLILLMALLPESRHKVDTDRVVFIALGCSSDVSSIASSNNTLEPYIMVYGEDQSNANAYLIVDKRVIGIVKMTELPFALMAAFFVYNICYPRGCSNFYSMLEILVLKYSSEKASPSIKHLLPKILPAKSHAGLKKD